MVSIAAQSDDEDEETVGEMSSREARWQRVAVAAIKQSLRQAQTLACMTVCSGLCCKPGCLAILPRQSVLVLEAPCGSC